ncbi:MAG: type IV toxin-antitoxin system AbiEi family antitoxin [Candidatus Riflebacteria bacterium]|nr:type IV toxin-antitoxin system AbiEi family antitoxin [Candidatus Riflebacteria bacterium]
MVLLPGRDKGRPPGRVSRPRPSPVAAHVDQLQASGRYVFTREELTRAIPDCSPAGVAQALQRLAGRGRIVRVRAGFHVIIPLEYRAAGILPPTWFIDDLMRSIGQPYYVGLLSAAALHGAAHQQPQEFQVVTNRPVRGIDVRGLKITFVTNSYAASVPVLEKKVETGSFRVSTPAATALDLVRYAAHSGGLSNVATVLRELTDTFTPGDLVAHARLQMPRERPTLQRLGFLLGRVGAREWEAALLPVVFPPRASRDSRKARTPTLPEVLGSVPADTFWKKGAKGRRVPDFNGVFAWYLRQLYPGGLPSGDKLVRDIASGRVVNLSTFQRSVAAEARRRVPSVPLRPDLPVKGTPVDARWAVIVNEIVEPDL